MALQWSYGLERVIGLPYHRDEPRWEQSEAERLLRVDMNEDKHKTMRPNELYNSRTEYTNNYPLTVFRKHIDQEERRRKMLSYYAAKNKTPWVYRYQPCRPKNHPIKISVGISIKVLATVCIDSIFSRIIMQIVFWEKCFLWEDSLRKLSEKILFSQRLFSENNSSLRIFSDQSLSRELGLRASCFGRVPDTMPTLIYVSVATERQSLPSRKWFVNAFKARMPEPPVLRDFDFLLPGTFCDALWAV